MAAEEPGDPHLTGMPLQILHLLRAHPDGLTIKEIRAGLNLAEGTQQHLDRRVRALDPHFEIERRRRGRFTVYVLGRRREPGEWDFASISAPLRAKILERDGRRCQMCGRSPAEDAVKLHVDHRIPREWGGETDEENLWALCSQCNEGKKNYFATFDANLMKGVLQSRSVHKRLATLLESKRGEWIDTDLLRFVANFETYQEDWQKRLRELRYFGWVIKNKVKRRGKRMVSFYQLVSGGPLPDDPTAAARVYERERASRNRRARRDQNL